MPTAGTLLINVAANTELMNRGFNQAAQKTLAFGTVFDRTMGRGRRSTLGLVYALDKLAQGGEVSSKALVSSLAGVAGMVGGIAGGVTALIALPLVGYYNSVERAADQYREAMKKVTEAQQEAQSASVQLIRAQDTSESISAAEKLTKALQDEVDAQLAAASAAETYEEKNQLNIRAGELNAERINFINRAIAFSVEQINAQAAAFQAASDAQARSAEGTQEHIEALRNMEQVTKAYADTLAAALDAGTLGEQILEAYGLTVDEARQKLAALQQALANLGPMRAQSEAERERAANVAQIVEQLQREIDAMSKTREELELLEAARREANDAEVRQIEELQRRRKELEDQQKKAQEQQRAYEDMQRRAQEIFEQTRTPLERYQEAIDELNRLYQEGLIDAETYRRAIEQAKETLEGFAQAAQEIGKPELVERRFTSGFDSSGFHSASDPVKTLIEMLRLDKQDHVIVGRQLEENRETNRLLRDFSIVEITI